VLALGFAAALLRPEAWPVLGAYGAWCAWTAPPQRRARLAWVLGLGAVAVLALWLVPEKLGSGSFLRGAVRAQEPVPNSPGTSAVPFLAVFTNSAQALVYPVYAGAVAAVVGAARRRDPMVLALAVIATVWFLAVAALAQNGFTGSLRYVTLPVALLCVLAGTGWARVARAAPRPLVALLVLAAVPGVVASVRDTIGDVRLFVAEDEKYAALPTVIARAGGPAALQRCGTLYTGPYETQTLTWQLHLDADDIRIYPAPPGTIVAWADDSRASDRRFAKRLDTLGWVVRSTC
jgi:hypothetical protein